MKEQHSYMHVSVAYLKYSSSSYWEYEPDRTAVFHVRLYGRFVEIKGNLWRKKLHHMNQSSNFLGNTRSPIQFRRGGQP